MELSIVKLVTIIAGRDLKEELVNLLKEDGISGYTVFATHGQGEKEIQKGLSEEQANILIEVLTEEAIASALMQKLAERYFPHERLIVYEQDVKVLRPQKFEKIAYKTYVGNWDPT